MMSGDVVHSSSNSRQQSIQPKPPAAPRSSSNNVRRNLMSNRSNNTDRTLLDRPPTPDDRPNSESRPLSSRLSRYSPLPQIGVKIDPVPFSPGHSRPESTEQKMKRCESMVSELDLNQTKTGHTILIGIRLPDGSKREAKFNTSDKMRRVLEFAYNEFKKVEKNSTIDQSQFALLHMPNLLIENFDRRIDHYNIENRSMLFLIDKNLVR